MVSLGSKRLVTMLIAGWVVLPALLCRGACVHGDVRAWVSCVRSGVCGGAVVWCVDLAWRGWEKRAGLGRRSHLELKGVGILFVERRRQGDDEW